MPLSSLAPFPLRPTLSPRPWGARDLRPWYDLSVATDAEPVGEVWLTGDDCIAAGGACEGMSLREIALRHGAVLGAREGKFPLLVKMLFPHEKLSVQVHPDDELASRLHDEPWGKTECWYVLEADAEARVALGLHAGTTSHDVEHALANGTVEQLLREVPIQQGDMVFVPAGAVHALLPGVVLLETQQNSDLTYRMFDYGRGRTLHLDQARSAIRLDVDAGKVDPIQRGRYTEMIRSGYFSVHRFVLKSEVDEVELLRLAGSQRSCCIAFVMSGECIFSPEQADEFALTKGETAIIPEVSGKWRLRSANAACVMLIQPGAPS